MIISRDQVNAKQKLSHARLHRLNPIMVKMRTITMTNRIGPTYVIHCIGVRLNLERFMVLLFC